MLVKLQINYGNNNNCITVDPMSRMPQLASCMSQPIEKQNYLLIPSMVWVWGLLDNSQINRTVTVRFHQRCTVHENTSCDRTHQKQQKHRIQQYTELCDTSKHNIFIPSLAFFMWQMLAITCCSCITCHTLTFACSRRDSTTSLSTRDGFAGIGGKPWLLSLDTDLPGFCLASSAST